MSSSIIFHAIPGDEDSDAQNVHAPLMPARAESSDIERQNRRSRNSTGIKEEFLPGPRVLAVLYDENDRIILQHRSDEKLKKEEEMSSATPALQKDDKMLAVVFVLMLFIGLGNKIFNKLMTIPMYNYPNFLNLLTTFVCKFIHTSKCIHTYCNACL